MHEAGLVKTLLQQVEDIVRSRNGHRVLEICVEAGPLSGVEPYLLQSAYEREVAGYPERDGASSIDLSSAQLQIDEVPIEATCEQCGNRFEIAAFDFSCSRCGSGAVKIRRGDSLRLMTVTFENQGDVKDTI